MALNEYMAKARVKYLRVALATLAAAFGITCVLALKSLPAAARQSIVAELEQRFHSTIEVADIQISGVIPLRIVAHNITLRYHGRSDVPPLMTITRFVGTAKLGSVWRRKWRIAQVHLEGLEIH